mmetsp:Transcript_49877/g.108886  ORF Transcript_49877/g.108886 Transcript_49877/m.108886 type:complete len:327 (-) Transcript_49877:18-998(-)
MSATAENVSAVYIVSTSPATPRMVGWVGDCGIKSSSEGFAPESVVRLLAAPLATAGARPTSASTKASSNSVNSLCRALEGAASSSESVSVSLVSASALWSGKILLASSGRWNWLHLPAISREGKSSFWSSTSESESWGLFNAATAVSQDGNDCPSWAGVLAAFPVRSPRGKNSSRSTVPVGLLPRAACSSASAAALLRNRSRTASNRRSPRSKSYSSPSSVALRIPTCVFSSAPSAIPHLSTNASTADRDSSSSLSTCSFCCFSWSIFARRFAARRFIASSSRSPRDSLIPSLTTLFGRANSDSILRSTSKPTRFCAEMGTGGAAM